MVDFSRRQLLQSAAGTGIGAFALIALPGEAAATDHVHGVATGEAVEVDLIAGHATGIGTVRVVPDWDGEELSLTYDTTDSGWEILETHLHVGTDFDDIPTNSAGNPKVGHFAYSDEPDPAPADVAEYTGLPIEGTRDDEAEIFIAAHAEVRTDGDESAWADGDRINEDSSNGRGNGRGRGRGKGKKGGGNWATYFVLAEEEVCIDPEVTTWDEIGDVEEAGGPVVLMGLDSELGALQDAHGTPEEHAAMVKAVLEDVDNDGEGILVLGGSENEINYIQPYWEIDIGDNVGEDVTFVHDPADIGDVAFEGYALIGVVSTYAELGIEGIVSDQNEALIDRSDDIADFVNDGGGLLGKTQSGLEIVDADPWGYVDPFGEFETREMGFDEQYEEVLVTDAGKDLGLTQEGMSGWCCYHETFPEFPDFFDVLIEHDDGESSPDYRGEAAAIGGKQVIIEREVSLRISGPATVEVGDEQCYGVELENRSDDGVEGAFEYEVTRGDGSVSDDLPQAVSLEGDAVESWTDALCVDCDDEGSLEVVVRFVEDGRELVDVTMALEYVDQCVKPQ